MHVGQRPGFLPPQGKTYRGPLRFGIHGFVRQIVPGSRLLGKDGGGSDMSHNTRSGGFWSESVEG